MGHPTPGLPPEGAVTARFLSLTLGERAKGGRGHCSPRDQKEPGAPAEARAGHQPWRP